MIKYYIASIFYGIFSFLLSFTDISAVEHLPNYTQEIGKIEKRLTSTFYSSKKQKKEAFRSMHTNLEAGTNNFAPPVFDFTGKNLNYMVAELTYIMQRKVDLKYHQIRNSGSSYQIHANLKIGAQGIGYNVAAENAVDPYPTIIRITEGGVQAEYRVINNYDGGNIDNPNQYQPGNIRLRRQLPYSQTITYTNNISNADYNKGSHKLLRALEIARRKVADHHKNPSGAEDRYVDVPVATGILMATKLLNDNAIEVNEFWHRNGKYHIFTGDSPARHGAFNLLANQYRNRYAQNGNLQQMIASVEGEASGVFGFTSGITTLPTAAGVVDLSGIFN